MIEDRRINAEFEGLSHGINPERIIDSTGYPMMICPMCEQILWNPQMCSDPDCGCTLCERCLKRAVEERETCEDCLQTTKYDPNPFFVKSFKNLTFRCHNNICHHYFDRVDIGKEWGECYNRIFNTNG